MMRTKSALGVVVMWAMGGCGDDAASTTPADTAVAADTAATADATSAAEVDASGGGCPFTGTWNLQNMLCGSEDITADWFRAIDRTTLAVTAVGSGCLMKSTNENASCKEEEQATLTRAAGDTWQVLSSGISACTPAACSFGGTDAACAAGDRAGTYDATVVLAGGKLRVTSARGICATLGGATATTMVLQPQ